MVQFGREVCRPTYPRCPSCPVRDLCPKIGVIPVPGASAYRDAELGGNKPLVGRE
jgi:hypothetical protein